MTEMLELPDKIFEAAMIIILQQAIMNILKTKKKHKLFDFYKSAESRSDLVASFLAILELAKDKSIYLSGEGENIQIELLEGNENT